MKCEVWSVECGVWSVECSVVLGSTLCKLWGTKKYWEVLCASILIQSSIYWELLCASSVVL